MSLLVRVDAVFRHFDFGDPTEGEEQLYEVLGWMFRGLFQDMGDSVGDRGLKHHALGMEAGQVHANELPCLQHWTTRIILPLPDAKCKLFPLAAIPKEAINLAKACRPPRYEI
jgi:hypothetical protein